MLTLALLIAAGGASNAWALLDARAIRGSNRVLSEANYAELKLVASDAAAGDDFGYSVAIDGNTVVIGATGAGTGGAVYVLRTTDGGATYVEVAKLTASDGAAYDGFGRSVSIDGDTIVVGAYADNIDGGDGGSYDNGQGSAYVYRTSDGGATYVEVAKLTAADAAQNDQFGESVAIDGGTIVVGAYGKDSSTGAVYVYRTTDGWGTYTEIKLTAADAAAGDWFGIFVAIDGDTIVVGASSAGTTGGAAYVFRTSDGGDTYDQVDELTPDDALYGQDYFGKHVAIDSGTIVVGASGKYEYPTTPFKSGVAYVFKIPDGGATYEQVAKLTASDAMESAFFGHSVAIEGDTVVVGAYYDGPSNSGSAYVFRTTDGGATYGQVAKLTSADAAARYDSFGYSVAIAGDTVVSGSFIGAAFVFSPLAPAVPQPTPAALESDSATRAGTLATVLGVVAATALAL